MSAFSKKQRKADNILHITTDGAVAKEGQTKQTNENDHGEKNECSGESFFKAAWDGLWWNANKPSAGVEQAFFWLSRFRQQETKNMTWVTVYIVYT